MTKNSGNGVPTKTYDEDGVVNNWISDKRRKRQRWIALNCDRGGGEHPSHLPFNGGVLQWRRHNVSVNEIHKRQNFSLQLQTQPQIRRIFFSKIYS